MIIAITGPDGSGKSTTCKKVAEFFQNEFTSKSISIASAWDEHSQLFSTRSKAQNYLNSLEGYTRSLFIFHSVSRSIDLAKRKNSKIILVDGYWYKYAVSEIGLGVSREWVISAAKMLPTPDFTLFLDILPEKAAKRKQQISEYEQGKSIGSNQIDRFVRFQTQLKPIWKEIEFQFGPWKHISSELDPDQVAQTLIEECLLKVA